MGEVMRTKLGNRFFFVLTDWFTKLTKKITFKRIKTTAVAHDFVYHWVLCYSPPKTVLSENGGQFMPRFSTEVCRIISTKKVYNTTYHLQYNSQVERLNCTIWVALRPYLGNHQRDCDFFKNFRLTYAYNDQMHLTTNISPSQLVLSSPPPRLELEYRPELEDGNYTRDTYMVWWGRLRILIVMGNTNMAREK